MNIFILNFILKTIFFQNGVRQDGWLSGEGFSDEQFALECWQRRRRS
jgi:hypothetical protein